MRIFLIAALCAQVGSQQCTVPVPIPIPIPIPVPVTVPVPMPVPVPVPVTGFASPSQALPAMSSTRGDEPKPDPSLLLNPSEAHGLRAPKVAGSSQSDSSTWVNLINGKRGHHGAPAMRWNQQMANEMENHLRRNGYGHSNSNERKGQGENIAWGSATRTPESTVSAWYNEYAHCQWPGCQHSKNREEVGHFTALVWKGASEVGCATVHNCNNGVCTGCRFKSRDEHDPCNTPNMNFDGHNCYGKNVAPPR